MARCRRVPPFHAELVPIGEFEVIVFCTFEDEKEDAEEVDENGKVDEEMGLLCWEERESDGVLPESISIVLRLNSECARARNRVVEKWEMFIKSVVSLVESEEVKRLRFLINTRELPAAVRRYEGENWGSFFDVINADYPFISFEKYASGFDGNGWKKWTFPREAGREANTTSNEEDEDGDVDMEERS